VSLVLVSSIEHGFSTPTGDEVSRANRISHGASVGFAKTITVVDSSFLRSSAVRSFTYKKQLGHREGRLFMRALPSDLAIFRLATEQKKKQLVASQKAKKDL
jgi:hypothetical protein